MVNAITAKVVDGFKFDWTMICISNRMHALFVVARTLFLTLYFFLLPLVRHVCLYAVCAQRLPYAESVDFVCFSWWQHVDAIRRVWKPLGESIRQAQHHYRSTLYVFQTYATLFWCSRRQLWLLSHRVFRALWHCFWPIILLFDIFPEVSSCVSTSFISFVSRQHLYMCIIAIESLIIFFPLSYIAIKKLNSRDKRIMLIETWDRQPGQRGYRQTNRPKYANGWYRQPENRRREDMREKIRE